jgi:hypothetical protein
MAKSPAISDSSTLPQPSAADRPQNLTFSRNVSLSMVKALIETMLVPRQEDEKFQIRND